MTYLSMLRVGCSPCISMVQAEAEMIGWQPFLISSTSLVSLIIQWEVESLESETESTFLSLPLRISGLDTTYILNMRKEEKRSEYLEVELGLFVLPKKCRLQASAPQWLQRVSLCCLKSGTNWQQDREHCCIESKEQVSIFLWHFVKVRVETFLLKSET